MHLIEMNGYVASQRVASATSAEIERIIYFFLKMKVEKKDVPSARTVECGCIFVF